MAMALYFAKRNKPENYLIHLIKYHLEPGLLSAGEDGVSEINRSRKIYE